MRHLRLVEAVADFEEGGPVAKIDYARLWLRICREQLVRPSRDRTG